MSHWCWCRCRCKGTSHLDISIECYLLHAETDICNIYTVLRMKSVANKNLANIARSNLQRQSVYVYCYRDHAAFCNPLHATEAVWKIGRKMESIFDFTPTYKMSAFYTWRTSALLLQSLGNAFRRKIWGRLKLCRAGQGLGSIFSRLRKSGFQIFLPTAVVCAKKRGRTKRLEIEPWQRLKQTNLITQRNETGIIFFVHLTIKRER